MNLNFEYLDDLIPEFEGLQKTSLDKFIRQRWVFDKQEDVWIENYKKIKGRIRPAIVTGHGAQRACVIVGSSPAIKKQVEVLKSFDDNFILIASNGAYRFLLEHDIIADYVFLMEGRDHIIDDVSCPHNGTKLIASPFVNPKVLDNWGDNYENYLVGGGPRFTEMITSDFEDIDVAGGNVVNSALLWAYKYLMCRNFVLCGVSLCFYDDYYVDGRDTKYVIDDFEKVKGFYKAADMYGEVVNTTKPLLMYKTWLETYSKMMRIDLVNSTEDGILGVYPKPIGRDENGINFRVKYLPWINIAPLHVAIRAFTDKLKDIGERKWP